MNSAHAIDVTALEKRYGATRAVDGLSFSIDTGEVFGLLGPNGAGKTTTVEILEGYRRADAGDVRVLGVDPWRDGAQLRPKIGVMLQDGGLYPGIRPLEALQLFASYYDDPDDPDRLLDLVGLREAEHTLVRRMSGGQQQRLSLALALVGRPSLVFLDEPTAGMDPRAAPPRGTSSATCATAVPPSCSPRTRCTRRSSSATGSASSTTAGSSAYGSPSELTTQRGRRHALLGRERARRREAGARARARRRRRCARSRPGDYVVERAGDARARRRARDVARARAHARSSELRAGQGSLEDVFLRLTGGRGRVKAPTRSRPRPASRSLLTVRRGGESLLVTLAIPLGILVFFTKVDAVNTTLRAIPSTSSCPGYSRWR